MRCCEGFHAPVIEDEQSGVGKLAQEFVVAAVGLGLGECQEQAGHTVVAGSVPVSAGLRTGRRRTPSPNVRQKDTEARWTKKRGKSHYGYKNHVCQYRLKIPQLYIKAWNH